jgi:hypothetical protein
MARAMSLVFTFEVTIDDVKHRVTNRPGDVIRLRALAGGGGRGLDEELAAGGIASYETLFRFAWAALGHVEDHRSLTWDDFVERCEAWEIVEDEPARPTDAAPSSEP